MNRRQFLSTSLAAAASLRLIRPSFAADEVPDDLTIVPPFNAVAIAFSPDGRKLAVGGFGARHVILFDAKSGKEIRRLTFSREGHGDLGVHTLGFSTDNKWLAAGGPSEKHTRVWALETGDVVADLPTELSTTSLSFSPDGKTLATGVANGALYLWNVAAKKIERSIDDQIGAVHSLAWSPDSKLLASGTHRGFVTLWSAESGKRIAHLHSAGIRSVNSVSFSPDGRELAAALFTNSCRVWNVDTQKHRDFGEKEQSTGAVAFIPNSNYLAITVGRSIAIVDAKDGKELSRSAVHGLGIGRIVCASDGSRIASYGSDRVIYVTSLAKLLKGFKRPERPVILAE